MVSRQAYEPHIVLEIIIRCSLSVPLTLPDTMHLVLAFIKIYTGETHTFRYDCSRSGDIQTLGVTGFNETFQSQSALQCTKDNLAKNKQTEPFVKCRFGTIFLPLELIHDMYTGHDPSRMLKQQTLIG